MGRYLRISQVKNIQGECNIYIYIFFKLHDRKMCELYLINTLDENRLEDFS